MYQPERDHYEHIRVCEDCSNVSGSIHKSAKEIRAAGDNAARLIEMALEDPHFEDDSDRRDVLISAARGLALAIGAQAKRIEDQTYERQPAEPQAVEALEATS